MKLSNLIAKLTSIKSTAVRTLAVATLAGAALAAVPAAQAQRVFIGVHAGPRFVARAPVVVYGGPAYPAPAYVDPGYYPGPAVYGSVGFYGHPVDRGWHDHGFARPLARRDFRR